MNYFPVRDQEAFRLTGVSYNEPAPDLVESGIFGREWHQVRGLLKQCLDQYGVFNEFGDGDYLIGDVSNRSRVIPVELTSRDILRPEVLEALISFLDECSEAYRLDLPIALENNYLLFVTLDKIVGWCSGEIEDRCGLKPVKG